MSPTGQRSPEAEWEVGAAVVFPGRGLGIVVERGMCAPLGTPREYLTIAVERVGMTIKVPVDRVLEAGARTPASAAEVRDALDVLARPPEPDPASWQTRIKTNREKLGDGSAVHAAEVLRDLSWRATRRPLGMQERDQQQQALELLRGQVMHAFALDESDADARLTELLPVSETTGS